MKKKFHINWFRLHKSTLRVITGIIIVILSYIALIWVDAPKSAIFTKAEEDRRIFAIGTLKILERTLQ